jgi:hypothetical protein
VDILTVGVPNFDEGVRGAIIVSCRDVFALEDVASDFERV